jgi:diguanylate cyclase (GGDEF)-like protein
MRIGFHTRLLLAAALPAVMVIVLLLIGFIDRHSADLELGLRERGQAAARQLGLAAEFPLFAGNRDGLERLVIAAQTGDDQIRGAAVIGRQGELRTTAGQFSAWVPRFDGAEQLIGGDSLIVATPIFRSAVPVDDLFAAALAPASEKPQLLGYAVIELSREALERQRRDMLGRILAITIGGLLLAALLSTVIASSVTRPIRHISQVVARIEQGEIGARTVAAEAGVLAPLAAGINDMAARVALTEEELRQQIALATNELRLQKEAAERAARVDTLTGVANRRAFSEIAENEVQRALRYGTPLSLVLIDLDHFKSINDHYGHQTGDAVLASFARTVTGVVREVDIVGRWGGEEFVVLLPGTAADEAMQAAERMRQAVADTRLQAQGRQIVYTASFGVAQFNPTELTFYGLVARADAALYRAKDLGRNRVELAGREPLPADG